MKTLNDQKAKQIFFKEGVTLNTSIIKINGFNIHYAMTGDDTHPTLFFVHGSPDKWTRYEKFMQDKDLLARYRMIAIDRPGFGHSEAGDAMDLEDQSRLISSFVRTNQNGKRIYAIGHSYGGAVIVKLQADNQLFDGLVLLAPSVDPQLEKPEKWRYIMNAFPLKYFLPAAYRASNKELVYQKKDLQKLDKKWDKITCPVWIIHGEKDSYVPLANTEYAKSKLTKARFVEVKTLPGADHFITDERCEEVKEVLRKLPK